VLGISCCANSQSVTLFADGDRNNGTEEVIFDTKQAEKIYYIRDYTQILPTETVLATKESGAAPVNDLSDSVDKDFSTDAFFSQTGGDVVVVRFNFQSDAVRQVVASMALNTQVTNRTLLVEARFATSSLSFSAYQTVILVPQNTTLPQTSYDMPFGSQNLQYVELRFTDNNQGAVVTRINEVFNKLTGFGSSVVKIQVKNDITGNFLTADALTEIIQGSLSQEKLDTKEAFQPNNSLTRIQLVNDGKWNGSVGAVLVNPKFT